MMHLTTGILSLLLAATAASAQAGPVGWWRGDDTLPTALDSTTNLFNGTYVDNAAPAAPVAPGPGLLFANPSSMTFDGTTDEVTVPDAAALRITGDITIGFWYRKTAEAGDWVRLVGKGAPAVRNYGVWEEAAAGTRILFQQYNGSGGSVLDLYSTGTIGLDTWTHVICVVEGTAATIYLDGNPSGSGTRSGTPGTDTQPVRFGYGEIHTYHPGQLDDIRIYNRALTAPQIALLAAGNPEPVAPTPVTLTVTVGQADLSWGAVPGAASYTIEVDTGAGFGPLISGLAGTSYTHTGLVSGTSVRYRVAAIGISASPFTTTASMPVPFPPPRTSGNDEGLLDDNCACGSSVTQVPWGLAFAALALLLALRRR